MNEFYNNEEQYTRVATFLARQAAKFGLTPEAMGRMKPTGSELYIRSQFNAGGNVPLLNGNSTQEVGVTNFDGNRLDNGRFFVAQAVTIKYGEAAAGKKVWEVNYNKKLPPELLASHFVARQNGEVIIKLPIVSIDNAKNSDEYYRRLGYLAIFEPTQTIDVTIETPQGSVITPAVSGEKSFVEVLIQGFETYVKR